ncbi:MAG: hypothetical protein JWQ07_2446, partial [Ramlibacter sp.]|nr:hypothetical protein [Ramlibacter sp.]
MKRSLSPQAVIGLVVIGIVVAGAVIGLFWTP